MSRIKLVETNEAAPEIASLYEAVKQKLGLVPNMVKALGNSKPALEGYLGLSVAVSSGTFTPRLREKIALQNAEANSCDYCLRAHTAIGGMLKLSDGEILDARRGTASDNKEQAILDLAKLLLETKGAVSDQDLSAIQAAGVSDTEATEVVLNVSLNILTNYFNRLVQTDAEFPAVSELNCPAA
ncbi:carboxymuconolactone decarboxylase family protein [Pelagicoccus albus]|uniref:Carboxymuconolactone decarboxylase family protein n=1 Tax=Pelagicoccus albus TaxID=415222 RepID=A0A7X1B357_9BACT|nr:carboxymuconolactone decarboxylase family protein [Pelagicoccus albus]MBC2604778.1 carboxymuconolactone decarboxylase family protein [Pelagicoccus albus]